MDDQTSALVIAMLKDLSEKSDKNFDKVDTGLRHVRDSSHRIMGDVQLLMHKDAAQTERIAELKKEIDQQRETLKKEMEEQRKSIASVKNLLHEDVKPKTDSIFLVYTWALRTLIAGIVVAVLVAIGLKTS